MESYCHQITKEQLVTAMLEQALEMPSGGMTPEEQILHRETYERFYAAITQLSPVQRPALRGNRENAC